MIAPVLPAEECIQTDTAQARVGRRGRSGLLLNIARLALDALLVLSIVVTGTVLVGSRLGAWRLATVLSGSMRPEIQPGDVEILRPEPIDRLTVGQIVAFVPPQDSFTVTHRVVGVARVHGRTYMRTKGDANNVADPWGPLQVLGQKIWVVTRTVPKVGYLTVWAKGRTVRLALLVAVVVVALVLAVERIWKEP